MQNCKYMAENEPLKFDEEPSKENTPTIVDSDSVKHGGAFSKLNRELQDEDLNNRGTQRLILNELDKYEVCKMQLEKYQERFHTADKENAVLKSQLNSSTAFEITNSFMLTIGSILIGLTPSINKDGETYYLTWIILGIGIVTLVGGIIAKFINRRK